MNEKIRRTYRNGTVPWPAPLFPREFWPEQVITMNYRRASNSKQGMGCLVNPYHQRRETSIIGADHISDLNFVLENMKKGPQITLGWYYCV